METSFWLPKARLVAHIEVGRIFVAVLATVGLAVSILVYGPSAAVTFFGRISESNYSISDNGTTSFAEMKSFEWEMWYVLGMGTFIALCDIFAVLMLLGACNQDSDVITAAMKARIWRNVTVITTICSIKGLLTVDTRLVIVTLIGDLVELVIVQMFIMELHSFVRCDSIDDSSETNLLAVHIEETDDTTK